jgi:hypothetical protein
MSRLKIAAVTTIFILCTPFVPRIEAFAAGNGETVNVIIDA